VPTEVRQMFIENPPTVFGFVDLFGTHPRLSSRIQRLSELGGLPMPLDTARLDTPPAAEALAANMGELRQTMQGLQVRLQALPRAVQSSQAEPSPAASASGAPGAGARKRGLGPTDLLVIAIGLAIGALIALVAF
jgi:hypothetical protein